MKKILVLVALLVSFSLFSLEEIAKEVKNAPKKKMTEGVKGNLSVSSNFILNDSRSVIGQQDGYNMTLGFAIKGGVSYVKKANEVQFNLDISEQFSRTPELERFIKSSDLAKFDLSYLYSISTVWGPFAKASFETSLLEGKNETLNEVEYLVPDEENKITDSMKLVSSLQPMILKQTAGVFYRPIKKEAINFQLNVGGGAMEVIADGGMIVNDDAATVDLIELTKLKSYNEFGSSIFMKVNGLVKSVSVINYSATLELMTPFLNDDDQDRGAFELTNIDFTLTLSSKITSWLSLNYELKITKTPQLLDEFQIKNNIMLSLNYMLLGK